MVIRAGISITGGLYTCSPLAMVAPILLRTPKTPGNKKAFKKEVETEQFADVHESGHFISSL